MVQTLVLLGLLGCDDCDPWPPPAPVTSVAKYLTVVPNELYVYVADPKRDEKVNLIAFVQDEYGRNLEDQSANFKVSSGGASFQLAPLGTNPDSVALTIVHACTAADLTCAPVPQDGVLLAAHGASGLSLDIPVHVRYDKAGDYGVAAVPAAPWPMIGLGTGRVSSVWTRNLMRPFARRAGLAKFDDQGMPAETGDERSGTVLSAAYSLWRKTNPWGASPTDVQVPVAGAAPAKVLIRAYYAGSNFAGDQVAFLLALQAGADIVSYTPVGALVTIDGGVKQVANMEWTDDCATLGTALQALPLSEQPSQDALAIYMLTFSASVASQERAAHCGVGKLATSGPLSNSQAIVLPQGSALPTSIAHEIGHAFALAHVTKWAGFFEDNLMVVTDGISAPMRSRLSIGQAFRAALDARSFIVTAGQAKSSPVDCVTTPMKCPGIALDAHARTP